MNYEDMTNEEVNFEVFHKLSDDVWDRQLSSKVWNLLSDKYDYCNDPSEAWEIILDNRITVSLDDETFAYKNAWCDEITGAFSGADYECYCNNPLRAAMIVFLMINEKS